MSESAGLRLRRAVQESALQVPGVPSAIFARLVERLGFRAGYLSGAAFSAGMLGLPDVGLFTLTELVEGTRRVTAASQLPLIVDADTGFGPPLYVERTVRELERAGAAAVQLEDQRLPKRCGHLSGKSLVDVDEMCAKLHAATQGRSSRDLVLVARTDARGVESFEQAVERAHCYLEAGADWVFPEALASEEEFAAFAQQVSEPLIANMTEFGKSPLMPFHRLSEIGYAAVLYPVTLLRVALRAAEATLITLQDEGTQASLLDLMQSREELYELLDYDDFEARDREHFRVANSSRAEERS